MAAFPSVIAAVFTLVETALEGSGARAVRGGDISSDPSDLVLVGRATVGDTGFDSAGTFQQVMQTFGGNRQETGTVNGLVVATNGQGDWDAACVAAFDYLALIETAVRANSTLGLTFEYTLAQMYSGDVQQSPDDGTTVALPFVISYETRI